MTVRDTLWALAAGLGGGNVVVLRSGVRVGAAAFTLGLCLAGPQTAVAAADRGDTGSSTVASGSAASGSDASTAPSARPVTASRSGRGRPTAAVTAPDAAVTIDVGRAATTPPSAPFAASPLINQPWSAPALRQPLTAQADNPSPASPASGTFLRNRRWANSAGSDPASSGTAPAAVMASASVMATPAGAVASLAAPARSAALPGPAAATAAAECGSCWAFGAVHAPSGRQVLAGVRASVAHLFDIVGSRLSGLPANPITDFLSGALWMIRRAVLPVGTGVGQWGTATCVATMDCSGQDLHGANFSGMDLSGVNFTDADLSYADLTEAFAVSANFTEADLSVATLYRADLSFANLNDAQLSGKKLREVNLHGATLIHAEIRAADLTKSDLSNTDLNHALISNSYLGGVNLRDANLADTIIRDESIFHAADLTNANLERAKIFDSYFIYGTKMINANLLGARLIGVGWEGAQWGNTTCPDGSKTNTGCGSDY